ncbi:hypothetical protein W97_06862 [Coniosporium apollinis CBS 100218]|uniref:C2H2-type domain-containing protein n=1 Tax=Coniosporium apollinis (strain CBS 100218) TaxID=1168221 RepID=R7Z108_CONA1|nr:uncharacterized protein W97_06862 [Coniosporium apollinis CBS 100218]EON67719.1 hypothetical protein W97_06862 [Coniosporium apollinis CBS 100218]
MVGSTRQTTVPTIMFICNQPGPRKDACKAVRESEVSKNYPAINFGHMSSPPGVKHLKQLATDNTVSQTDGNIHQAGAEDVRDHSVGLSGRHVMVTHRTANGVSTRMATPGGIVQCGGTAYILTSGHVFSDDTQAEDLSMPSECDDEYELYDNNDDHTDENSYDEMDVDITSKGSTTPDSDRSVYGTGSENSSSGFSSVRGVSIPDTSTQIDDRTIDPQAGTNATGAHAPGSSNLEPKTPTLVPSGFAGIPDSLTGLTATAGRLKLVSIDLDYALIEIAGPSALAAVEELCGSGHEADLLQPTHVVTTGPKDTKIVTYTASQGYLTGTLSGTPSYTHLPGSRTYQEVYMVQLNGPLAKGDSGSWIIGAETHGLYGHIIAGCEHTRVAYVMPAYNVFKDARKRLHSQLHLHCKSPIGETSTEQCVVPVPSTGKMDPNEVFPGHRSSASLTYGIGSSSAIDKQLSLLEDWSGRGSHVGVNQNDTIPLQRGRQQMQDPLTTLGNTAFSNHQLPAQHQMLYPSGFDYSDPRLSLLSPRTLTTGGSLDKFASGRQRRRYQTLGRPSDAVNNPLSGLDAAAHADPNLVAHITEEVPYDTALVDGPSDTAGNSFQGLDAATHAYPELIAKATGQWKVTESLNVSKESYDSKYYSFPHIGSAAFSQQTPPALSHCSSRSSLTSEPALPSMLNETPYTCNSCDASFKRAADLTRHRMGVHGENVISFECDFAGCGRVGSQGFRRKDHLREHQRNVHGIPISKREKSTRALFE